MKDKNTRVFVIVAVALMAILTIGSVSYAYFTTLIEEGDVYSLKGKANLGGYRINFTETKAGVSLTETYPMPEGMGLQLEPYTFTVTSEESVKIGIKVIVEVLNTSTLDDSLVSIGVGSSVKTLGADNSETPSEDTYRSAYKVMEFNLNPGASRTVDIRTWINELGTVDNAQNKTWSGRILVVPGEYREGLVMDSSGYNRSDKIWVHKADIKKIVFESSISPKENVAHT